MSDIEIKSRHFLKPQAVVEGKKLFVECVVGNSGCCFEALELLRERKISLHLL